MASPHRPCFQVLRHPDLLIDGVDPDAPAPKVDQKDPRNLPVGLAGRQRDVAMRELQRPRVGPPPKQGLDDTGGVC